MGTVVVGIAVVLLHKIVLLVLKDLTLFAVGEVVPGHGRAS